MAGEVIEAEGRWHVAGYVGGSRTSVVAWTPQSAGNAVVDMLNNGATRVTVTCPGGPPPAVVPKGYFHVPGQMEMEIR